MVKALYLYQGWTPEAGQSMTMTSYHDGKRKRIPFISNRKDAENNAVRYVTLLGIFSDWSGYDASHAPDARPPRIITFDDCPTKNPYNWSFSKKLYVVAFTLLSVMNSGVSASLPSNAVPYIMDKFNLDDNGQSSLPTGIFLIGYVVGPLIWSPLSETIGRRPVLLYTFVFFFLFTLACALAPGWSSLLFFRFVCGCMGAAPQTVIGGAYADVFEAKARGRAMAFYMAVCQSVSVFALTFPGSELWADYRPYYIWVCVSAWLEVDLLD